MAASPQTTPGIWPAPRFWNIVARTAHIVVAGALFGGHVFDTHPERLLPWLYAAVATGAALVVLEAYPSVSWLWELRGLAVLGKIALLLSIPWFWPHRVWLLIAVFVLASAGSHMPRRWRHFSLLFLRPASPVSSVPAGWGRPDGSGPDECSGGQS